MLNESAVVIRKASAEDISSLTRLWFDFFAADGGSPSPSQRILTEGQLAAYFKRRIEDGTFIASLAEVGGAVVSAAFLVILEKPTNLYCLTGKGGTLLNVLTYPDYRRKGLAKDVLRLLFDEALKNGVEFIELLATEEGLPLYEKLGFSASKYTPMRLFFGS